MGAMKECPVCRMTIGHKRMIVKDPKTEMLISRLIPSRSDYETWEQEEAKRQLKSSESKKKLKDLKKLRNKQIRKEEKIRLSKLKEKEIKEKRRADKARAKQAEARVAGRKRQRPQENGKCKKHKRQRIGEN